MFNHTCEIPPSTGESSSRYPRAHSGCRFRSFFNGTRSTILEVNSAEYSDPEALAAESYHCPVPSISPLSSSNQAEKASASQGSEKKSTPQRKSDSNSSGRYSIFRKPPTESTFKQAGNARSGASSSVSLTSAHSPKPRRPVQE